MFMTRWLPRFALVVVLVSSFAVNAFAQATGVNLSWTDCGTTGTANVSTACASNAGANSIIASFIPPGGIAQYVGLSAVVDITSQSGLIPSWWDMTSTGCRPTGMSVSFDFTSGPFTCTDIFSGQALGAYQFTQPFDSTNFGTSATAPAVNHARLRIAGAMATGAPLDSSMQYYGFKITLSNKQSVGVGNCAGCSTPMCIVLNSIELGQPGSLPSTVLTGPPAGGNDQITFQGAGANCSAVPTRSKTWGQIKSLYR
jgi:hypothetical protein